MFVGCGSIRVFPRGGQGSSFPIFASLAKSYKRGKSGFVFRYIQRPPLPKSEPERTNPSSDTSSSQCIITISSLPVYLTWPSRAPSLLLEATPSLGLSCPLTFLPVPQSGEWVKEWNDQVHHLPRTSSL